MDEDIILEDSEDCFNKYDEVFDFAYALSLQETYEKESIELEKKVVTSNDKSKELSIVDEQWELIDPNPDIHALFIQFDTRFFYNKLQAVTVSWSPRMTLCAGLCCYQGKGGLCSIRLSLPLLKLRPRRDLVETLLHEMIHAYLFVTENYRDRSDHGPNFLSHMYRINKLSGTNITVYHSFHDEVDFHKRHWWKCDGPCQYKKPFFGLVKRSMNRAPGPNDTWWKEHQSTCGGKFLKIKEPENYKKTTTKRKNTNNVDKDSNIEKFLKSTAVKSESTISIADMSEDIISSPKQNFENVNTLNTPSCSGVASSTLNNFVPFQGNAYRLTGSSKGSSNLLDKFLSKTNSQTKGNFRSDLRSLPEGRKPGATGKDKIKVSPNSFCSPKTNQVGKLVQRPINEFLSSKSVLESCSNESSQTESSFVNCPVCSTALLSNEINSHLDICLS